MICRASLPCPTLSLMQAQLLACAPFMKRWVARPGPASGHSREIFASRCILVCMMALCALGQHPVTPLGHFNIHCHPWGTAASSVPLGALQHPVSPLWHCNIQCGPWGNATSSVTIAALQHPVCALGHCNIQCRGIATSSVGALQHPACALGHCNIQCQPFRMLLQ